MGAKLRYTAVDVPAERPFFKFEYAVASVSFPSVLTIQTFKFVCMYQ